MSERNKIPIVVVRSLLWYFRSQALLLPTCLTFKDGFCYYVNLEDCSLEHLMYFIIIYAKKVYSQTKIC